MERSGLRRRKWDPQIWSVTMTRVPSFRSGVTVHHRLSHKESGDVMPWPRYVSAYVRPVSALQLAGTVFQGALEHLIDQHNLDHLSHKCKFA